MASQGVDAGAGQVRLVLHLCYVVFLAHGLLDVKRFLWLFTVSACISFGSDAACCVLQVTNSSVGFVTVITYEDGKI